MVWTGTGSSEKFNRLMDICTLVECFQDGTMDE